MATQLLLNVLSSGPLLLGRGDCINIFLPEKEKSMSLICMLNWGRTRETWTREPRGVDVLFE